ncbi:MAG: hypothetical protein PWP31_2043 [Clostridia bacterium]|nr:hypothetical protein [Clostridia bacterium]
MKKLNKYNKWYWPILMIFILAGLFYNPAIGLFALICMISPIIVGISKGRMWCGRFCPRGSFLDQILSKVGNPNRKIPKLFKNPLTRWVIFILLMSYMGYNVYLTGGNIFGIGRVLFKMVLITTIAGIVLGYFYNVRSWCKICPMGSLAMIVSKKNEYLVQVNPDICKNCGICSKNCNFEIPVNSFKISGQVEDPDCLKCSTCVSSCPVGALKLDQS